MFRRVFQRIVNITPQEQPYSDLWRSLDEKKDLFIFISLTSFVIFAVFLNPAMLSGWRHFYFLHFFIIYITIYTLNLIFLYFKRKKFNIPIFSFVNLFFVIFIIRELFIFHPYQSLYFNSLINQKNYFNFPIDTPSLTRSDALKFILNDGKNLTKIYVSSASWTPLHNGKDLLNDSDKMKLVFVGQDYNKADYIYTNYNYEVDPKFNKKYNIPNQFNEIKRVSVRDITIYSIYKKSR